MTPFNWDHPSLVLSHHVHRDDVSLSVPSWVLPRTRFSFWEAGWWTPDRMENALSASVIVFALLFGYALGAR